MKDETEVKWLINLISSKKLISSLFGSSGGSIVDFEKASSSPTNNKYFRDFFKKMNKEKIINFSYFKENSRGNPIKIYTINKVKMLKYLKTFDYYNKVSNIAVDDFKSLRI